MRKLKIFGALLVTLALVACNEKKPETSHVGDNGLTYANEMYDSLHFVRNNFADFDEVETLPDFKILDKNSDGYSLEKDGLKEDLVVSTAYASRGVITMRNEAGYHGLFSTLFNKWIVKPSMVQGTYSYSVVDKDGIGAVILLHANDRYYCYDSLGHLLAESPLEILAENIVSGFKAGKYGVDIWFFDENEPYIDYEWNDETQEWEEVTKYGTGNFIYYLYNEKGVPTVSETSWQSLIEEEEEIVSPFDKWQVYEGGTMDLGAYGLEGYCMTVSQNGSFYAVYKLEGDAEHYYGKSFVSSFSLDPNQYGALGLVGHSLVAQGTWSLPTDATEYDYSVGNNKYANEIIAIDLFTGVRSSLDYKLRFTSTIAPLKNIQGEGEEAKTDYYFAISFKEFTKDHLLSEEKHLIVDKEFVVVEDHAGQENFDFYDMTNGYIYNYRTRFIYDENNHPVTSLTGYDSVTPYPQFGCFLVRHNNLYGLVRYDGYIVTDCKFSTIDFEHGVNGYFYAYDSVNAVWSIVSVNGASESYGYPYRSHIAGNLFALYNSDAMYTYGRSIGTAADYDMLYISSSYYEGLNDYYLNTSVMNILGHNAASFLMRHYDSYFEEWDMRLASFLEVDFDFSFAGAGTEQTTGYHAGTYDDPAVLTLGENVVPTKMSTYTYVSFTPTEDHKFGLEAPMSFNTTGYDRHILVDGEGNPILDADGKEQIVTDYVTVVNTYDSEMDTETEEQYSYHVRTYAWELKAGHTYIFAFNGGGQQVTKLRVVAEHEHTTDEYKLDRMSGLLDFANAGGNYVVPLYGVCDEPGCGELLSSTKAGTATLIDSDTFKAAIADKTVDFDFYGAVKMLATGDTLYGSQTEPTITYTWMKGSERDALKTSGVYTAAKVDEKAAIYTTSFTFEAIAAADDPDTVIAYAIRGDKKVVADPSDQGTYVEDVYCAIVYPNGLVACEIASHASLQNYTPVAQNMTMNVLGLYDTQAIYDAAYASYLASLQNA